LSNFHAVDSCHDIDGVCTKDSNHAHVDIVEHT
jgi:hypothetical protein